MNRIDPQLVIDALQETVDVILDIKASEVSQGVMMKINAAKLAIFAAVLALQTLKTEEN